MQDNIEKKLIYKISSHLEEDSNRIEIVEPPPRIPGIKSPYNAKAFNIDVESSSSPSRMSQQIISLKKKKKPLGKSYVQSDINSLDEVRF